MMKNKSILWMLFMAVLAYGQTAWAQWTGSGTEAAPYKINSIADWNTLATNVNDGNTYSGKYFQLTTDIGTTIMVGTSTNKFSGTFDGNGYTLTFNQENTNSENQYIAPFRYINNATVQNLKVSGTVTSNAKFAGGVVAHATGSNTITNCVNSTIINATIEGNGSHGGILGQLGGNNSSVTIFGCLFNGKMLGTDTDYWCGMIGYFGSNSVTISNCFFNPQQVDVKSVNQNYTICRSGATVKNCFYNAEAAKMYEKQGKQIYSIVPGQHVTMRLLGIAFPYNVSGLTIYGDSGHGLKFGDVFYAASGDVLNLELSLDPGYVLHQYYANENLIDLSGFYSDSYSLTMPAEDVTITAYYSIADWDGDGSQEYPYLIRNKEQLRLLSENKDIDNKYFKLMVDVTLPDVNDDVKIWSRVTLDMNGKVISSGDSTSHIFHVSAQNDLPYTPSLTLTGNGTLQGYDGTISADGDAIYNEGILNLQDSVTIQNFMATDGGAVYNAGTMTMSGGTNTGCSATESGGGIYNAGTMTMSGGTITGCSATSSGGGIYNAGTMMMSGNPKVYGNTGNFRPCDKLTPATLLSKAQFEKTVSKKAVEAVKRQLADGTLVWADGENGDPDSVQDDILVSATPVDDGD